MGKSMAITISTPPSQFSVLYRIQDHHTSIDESLRKICKSYILYPEFDEQGRLHYHGMINGYDEIKYFHLKWKLDRVGYTLVKPIKQPLIWVLYCQKSWRRTSRVFEKSNIEITPLFKIKKIYSKYSDNYLIQQINKTTTILDAFARAEQKHQDRSLGDEGTLGTKMSDASEEPATSIQHHTLAAFGRKLIRNNSYVKLKHIV